MSGTERASQVKRKPKRPCEIAFAVGGAERYAFVRSYKVDGKPVTLEPDETRLDLAKIYPADFRKGAVGERWADVETTIESDADKSGRIYYMNDWYGELHVNEACIAKNLSGPCQGFNVLRIPLRKGANTIRLRTRSGIASWTCSLAHDGVKRPGEADCTVDFTKAEGRIRPLLHSSGFGPMICSCPQETIDLLRSMNLTAARTHDWALINPNERVCDYFHLFPLMQLDATNPGNYHFGPTDYLLKRTREETGLDIFFRLGTSIEHAGEKMQFNSLIPDDFDKVAEIFAGTVRHYNRGWANGFGWNIKYWEIWNEPDGYNNMWCLPDGDGAAPGPERAAKDAKRRDRFARFYVTCLKRLKSEFGDSIKVGGPALCTMNDDYFTALLAACRKAGVAPDFISWHCYGSHLDDILDGIARARRLCDDHGFKNCELVINEWHYMGFSFSELWSTDPAVQERCWTGPAAHNGTDSAAFTLSALARFQSSALDQAYFYGCAHKGDWGFMDARRNLNKAYYALKAFGEIVKGYPRLGEVKTTGSLTTLVAKSADGARTTLLVADYRGLPGDITLAAKGLPAGRPQVRVLDHTRDLAPVEARLSGDRIVLPKLDDESASFLLIW